MLRVTWRSSKFVLGHFWRQMGEHPSAIWQFAVCQNRTCLFVQNCIDQRMSKLLIALMLSRTQTCLPMNRIDLSLTSFAPANWISFINSQSIFSVFPWMCLENRQMHHFQLWLHGSWVPKCNLVGHEWGKGKKHEIHGDRACSSPSLFDLKDCITGSFLVMQVVG